MIADALPAATCVVIVARASDQVPMCVLGVAIVGTPADHAAAAAWAQAHGYKTSASKGQGGVDEQLIFFMGTGTVADLATLKAMHRNGAFGSALLQVFAAPQSVAADGIDLDTELKVADADMLAIPTK